MIWPQHPHFMVPLGASGPRDASAPTRRLLHPGSFVLFSKRHRCWLGWVGRRQLGRQARVGLTLPAHHYEAAAGPAGGDIDVGRDVTLGGAALPVEVQQHRERHLQHQHQHNPKFITMPHQRAKELGRGLATSSRSPSWLYPRRAVCIYGLETGVHEEETEQADTTRTPGVALAGMWNTYSRSMVSLFCAAGGRPR